MAASLQTFPAPAIGGLDLVSPPQVLSRKPGAAVELNDFEALIEGGYRRINGMLKYSDLPDVIDSDEIRGIAYYKGVVVVCGEYLLHSPDAATWFIVNRKDCDKVPSDKLLDLDIVPREGHERVEFSVTKVKGDDVLVITDDMSKPAMLHVDADIYTYKEAADDETKGYQHITKYQDHVVLGGGPLHPNSVVVSARFDPLDYSGTGAWSVEVADEVMGLHTFRDFLYIFCRSAIYRLVNLESSKNAAVRPVTTKIGCVDGHTIQEIGGDILFLADDGLRYLGATDRIDDVSINLVSDPIRPLITSIDANLGPVSSVVIPSKAQYRLFFTDNLGRKKGIIGTLLTDGSFSWSTTSDMWVKDITITTEDNDERVFHIGSPTIGTKRVYYHDTGIDFDGTPIRAHWTTPYFNMGDPFVRKNLHFLAAYLEAEDKAEVEINLLYDHEDPTTLQPEPFYMAPVVEAARWGEAVWGEFQWGAIRYPLNDIFLEGSGKWAQLTFKDNAIDNSPYIIRGYDLQFTPAGRI